MKVYSLLIIYFNIDSFKPQDALEGNHSGNLVVSQGKNIHV